MPKNLCAAGAPWPFVFDSCHFWIKNSLAKRDLAFGKAKVTRIMPNKMSQFSKHAGKSQPFGTHGQTVANQPRNRIQKSSSKHKKTIGKQPPNTSTPCKKAPNTSRKSSNKTLLHSSRGSKVGGSTKTSSVLPHVIKISSQWPSKLCFPTNGR